MGSTFAIWRSRLWMNWIILVSTVFISNSNAVQSILDLAKMKPPQGFTYYKAKNIFPFRRESISPFKLLTHLENPKPQIPNAKQYQNPKFKIQKRLIDGLQFGICYFGFFWALVLVVWDFRMMKIQISSCKEGRSRVKIDCKKMKADEKSPVMHPTRLRHHNYGNYRKKPVGNRMG